MLDLSGRAHLSCDLQIPAQRIGNFDTELVEHFFMSFANTSGACAACGLPLHAAQWSKHLLMCCVEAFTPFCCSCALVLC